MNASVQKSDKTLSLILEGAIDQAGAEELKRKINETNFKGLNIIIIDFGNVSYIGSAGIGKLLLLYKNLPSSATRIDIVNVPPGIYDLLKDMELDQIFTIERAKL